jgi:mRNA export factor
MFGSGASSSTVDTLNPNNDVIVQPVLADGISSLAFSPRPPNLLIGTCWDNNVYCWEVSSNGQATAKAQTSHTAPPLCCAWNSDGTGVFTGGCDKTVKLWNLATNQSQQVAQHDAPVRHCFWMPDINLLATGSWDKTIRYWDCRQPNPTLTVQLPERVYAMDVKYPLMVVGTANRQVLVYNLTSPQQPYKTIDSPLKFQTRCVSCFPDKTGYLVGSIEGRVAVQHVDDANAQKNFTFKCHRDGSDIYAVNSITFHPYGTFVTAGSDGSYNFWDKDSKQRLKQMQRSTYQGGVSAPIPCTAFSADGMVLAYALSYDWSRGYSQYNPSTMPNRIMLHGVNDTEVSQAGVVSRTIGARCAGG